MRCYFCGVAAKDEIRGVPICGGCQSAYEVTEAPLKRTPHWLDPHKEVTKKITLTPAPSKGASPAFLKLYEIANTIYCQASSPSPNWNNWPEQLKALGDALQDAQATLLLSGDAPTPQDPLLEGLVGDTPFSTHTAGQQLTLKWP